MTVDYLDGKRQDHTDSVIKRLGKRVFNDWHDDASGWNDMIKGLPSANERHPEPHPSTGTGS